MLALAALLLLWELSASFSEKDVCVFETLTAPDSEFCRGGMAITYPDLDASCSIIPSCAEYRQSLISDWGPPVVKFPYARMDKKYVLIMVDPDAPNRVEPKFRFWRHWVVTDIQGQSLIDGNLKGKILSGYRRPNPPRSSGYHRYQFFLYEQTEGEDITMTDKERGTYGSWDMDKFVETFHLGSAEATSQFMTESV